MRRISTARKEKEGYGCGKGASYVPYIKVGEFGSYGTASAPIDWKTGRLVHLFSQAEAMEWHILRWDDNISDIREQYPLNLDETTAIAKRLSVRPPNNGRSPMTSDFLVTWKDFKESVISVKASRDSLDDNRTLEKLFIEKEYWNRRGVPFELVFKTDLNTIYAENIRHVVAFHDEKHLSDDISILKHLISHKYIIVDMESAHLNYPELLKVFDCEVKKWKQKNWTYR